MGEESVEQPSSLTQPSCEIGAKKKKKNSFNFKFKFQKASDYYSLFNCELIPIKGPKGKKKKKIWSLYLSVSVLVRLSVSPLPE